MNILEQTANNTISKYNMINSGDRLLIALSGGADSTALLLLLHGMKGKLAVSLAAAHINHNLRETAKSDEEFCRKLCGRLSVPLYVLDADVTAYARENKLGAEEAGRQIRYRFLRQTATEQNFNRIVTAHHLNDSAESLLMNLFRGSGLTGLLGIPPVNKCEIIRPLILCSREEILAFLGNEPYCTDETNMDSTYKRNAVRNNLLPKIEKVCPDFTVKAARTIGLLSEENDFIEETAKEAFDLCVKIKKTSIDIITEDFAPLHMAIKRRVIRMAVSRVHSLYNVTEKNTEDILNLFDKQTGSLLNLKDRVTGERLSDAVRLSAARPLPPSSEYVIKSGVINALEFGLKIYVDKLPVKEKVIYTFNINCDRIVGDLILRTRRPGDYLRLTGVGTKSLSDYLIDRKVPKSERDFIPLFAVGSEIIAMNGVIHGGYDKAESGERLTTISVTEDNNGDC